MVDRYLWIVTFLWGQVWRKKKKVSLTISSKLFRSLKALGVNGISRAWYLKIFEDLGISLYLNGLWQISVCIPAFAETVVMSKNFCDLKGKVVRKFPDSTLFSEGHCCVLWHISRKYNELTSGYRDSCNSLF